MIKQYTPGSTSPDLLLGRPSADVLSPPVEALLEGRTVLVTGAAGSIGSEIVRQVRRHSPEQVFLLDHDEAGLHQLQLELTGHGLFTDDSTILGDIRDPQDISRILRETNPDIVYHAAAVKHLPLLERYPLQGFRTNVLGTRNVVKACQEIGVSRFVNISTDKAATPSSVLGLTKRLAEYVSRAYGGGSTSVASVRFGNVLGSRGSFLPTLEWQLRHGLELTLTHPDVTRYFMTIPEAAGLVLEASAMAQDGETYVLDMGDPVRIADLIERFVSLTGSPPPSIRITGLRPGEKMHEALWSEGETPHPTAHPRIRRTQVAEIEDCRAVLAGVEDLDAAASGQDLVDLLWRLFRPSEGVIADLDLDALEEAVMADIRPSSLHEGVLA